MDAVLNRGCMDPVHESSPWTRSKLGVNGTLVHIWSSPPFTQGHSGVIRFLVVFILRFVETGIHSPLSFLNNRSDPAP